MKSCFTATDILLPDFRAVDPQKWATVACDQFTSEPEYWENADALVGLSPSTLRMMLPEVYLGEAKERIPLINQTMKEYLGNLLVSHEDSMIFVERVQSDGTVRRGIVMAIDLACYDYTRGASSLIRATEATVVERIPPRVAIRRGAAVELPHVMLLINDPEKTVIEPLVGKDTGEVAYDTDLMLRGGHITGRFLAEDEIDRVSSALLALSSPEEMAARYGKEGISPLLFAVGDGNHSLATAKALYEEIKEKIGEEAAATHPARFALAEVVNIHDEALKFEPIYRVLFGVDPADVTEKLKAYARSLSGDAKPQRLTILREEGNEELTVPAPVRQLTVGTLQDFIDDYLSSHPEAEVDYIHGEESTLTLSKKPDRIGFLFSGMEKDELFPTVIFDGALPRKTFSMGHAEDKRYYMECRKIVKDEQ